jgi:hypothetical protein
MDLAAGRCRCWWRRPSTVSVEGAADTVDARYVRELADSLPD